MAEIVELVKSWQELVRKRKSLKELSDKLEEAEKFYEQKVQTWLDANGQASCRMADGSGTVSRRTTYSARLLDPEKFSELMLTRMTEAKAAGKPVTNGLLWQKRPLKEGVEAEAQALLTQRGLAATPENIAAVAQEFGIEWHAETKLSFTKR